MTSASSSGELYAALASLGVLRERLEVIGGRELLDLIDAGVAEAKAPEKGLAHLGSAALTAAASYTFSIRSTDALSEDDAALIGASAAIVVNGQSRLQLNNAARAEVINSQSNKEILQELLRQLQPSDALALSSDAADADTLASAWIRAFLREDSTGLERQSAKRLAAACAARSVLDGVVSSLPDAADLKRHRDIAELVEPLRLMVGQGDPCDPLQKDRFAGRQAELAVLRSFVDELGSESLSESISRGFDRFGRALGNTLGNGRARILMISARGGLGKSTLVAKFTLDHVLAGRRLPLVYLDFDSTSLQPRSPLQLLIESARQIALFSASSVTELERLQGEAREVLAGRSKTSFPELCGLFRSIMQSVLEAKSARTFLVVLDTLEIVQSEPRAVQGIVDFLSGLAQGGFPQLAMVISGRAEFEELCANEQHLWSIERLGIEPLNVSDAALMANLLGESLIGEDWNPAWARKVAGKSSDPPVRREPLTIRIAVEILRNASQNERQDIAENIALLGERADKSFVGRLYEKRILEHIADPDARKLAWPGLVARRISRAMARSVLAPLCGLTPAEADAAFDRLGREVWVVDRIGTGEQETLRHRADLRARTLPLMRRRDPVAFARLTSAMVDHYASSSKTEDVAESIYYRLLRGDDSTFLGEEWSAEIVSLLALAKDDFEEGSEVWFQIQSRFATRPLPPAAFASLPDNLLWRHLARAGGGLRQMGDKKVDQRIVDAVRRDPVLQEDSPQEFSTARQSVLIKGGAWREVAGANLIVPSNSIDAVQSAFFFMVKAGIGNQPDGSGFMLNITDRRLDSGTWQLYAYLLLPALLTDRRLYDYLDERLAELLPSVAVKSGIRSAVRAALTFGTKSLASALTLFVRLLENKPRSGGSTISSAELLALTSSRSLTRFDNNHLLHAAGDEVAGQRGPRRISDPMLVEQVIGLLKRISEADEHSPELKRTIRRFASVRLEGLHVPVGYAISVADVLDSSIGRRFELRYGSSESGLLKRWLSINTNPRSQLDPVRLALLADEASDLRGFLNECVELNSRQDLSLNYIARVVQAWSNEEAWKFREKLLTG